jgi:hypothetical protein
MATDIGSLAAGLDGDMDRLGLDARDYEKTWEFRNFIFRSTPISIVDCLAFALLNIITRLPIFFGNYHSPFWHRCPALSFFILLVMTLV